MMDFLSQMDELNKPTLVKKPWMEEVDLLLGTVELLEQIYEECVASGIAGLDLETSGLDQRAFPNDVGRLETVDKIVGVCIAPTVTRGYYLPARHRGKGSEANIPIRLLVDLINRLQEAGVVFVFHNAKFDQKFLECEPAGEMGKWDNPKGWEDTWIEAYLRNSRAKQKGLKFLAQEDLGREMFELDELFLKEKGKKVVNKDFSLLDPTWEPTVWYAAADAVNTLALHFVIHPTVVGKDKFGNSQKTVYMIEKICLTATRWMEQCRIHIDRAKLEELIRLGQVEWWEAVQTVYTAVSEQLGRNVRPAWVLEMEKVFDPNCIDPGYREVRESCISRTTEPPRPTIPKSVPSLMDPKVRETVQFSHIYDITIPAQLGALMREAGVRGLVPTEKSGQVKTSKDVLDAVIDAAGSQFPWMPSIKRFREVSKSLGTTLCNIWADTAKERSPDGCVWANFNGLKTDTGRFSTPTPSKKTFFGQVNWNVQSTTATYDKSKPECSRRQRECITARDGYLLFAIDYSGVELRIVTNLSGEPKWINEFFRCSQCEHTFERGVKPPPFCPECGSDKIGDLHTLTAIGIYGSSDKLKRQTGKIVNFLLCYGGSGKAVMRSTGCDEAEGWRIKNQFDKTYKGLLRWWKGQHRTVRKQKYVTTAFGRKCPLPDIDHEFGKFRSKAERNAVNAPVQGSSADIMKLAMGLLYREFIKRGWIKRGPGLPDLVLMTITIHDELVFEVHHSIVGEAIPVIEQIMCEDTVKNLGWLVPLKVDIEFGDNWTVPMNLTEMAWNKGGGKWTAELAEMLPTFYANYLRCGGVPVDGAPDAADLPEIPEDGAGAPLPPPPPEKKAIAPIPESLSLEQDGDMVVLRLKPEMISTSGAKKVAALIHRVDGRGDSKVMFRDGEGNDLLPAPIKVVLEDFQTLARYEGF